MVHTNWQSIRPIRIDNPYDHMTHTDCWFVPIRIANLYDFFHPKWSCSEYQHKQHERRSNNAQTIIRRILTLKENKEEATTKEHESRRKRTWLFYSWLNCRSTSKNCFLGFSLQCPIPALHFSEIISNTTLE